MSRTPFQSFYILERGTSVKYTVDLSSNICNLWLCPNKIKSASLSLNNSEIACSSSFVIGAKGCSSIELTFYHFQFHNE